MLRSIRDITRRTVNHEHLEHLIAEKEELFRRSKRKRHDPSIPERLAYLRDRINRTMFVPQYVTVVMDHNSHYDYMFHNGFYINGRKYVRASCSAGQARVATVVFCDAAIWPELQRRLNNGRDPNYKIAPSKFNAYFGLTTTATHIVSEPRFIVVPDYKSSCTYEANFDTEQDWHIDDEITQKTVTQSLNRADGQGLITPEFAAKWAEDIGLDYVPEEFVIRQSFIKGMLAQFPVQEFAEEHSPYVKTIWGTTADLREVDVILSESQFKLWDAYPDQETYIRNCHENKLYWGVTQFAPKELKNSLTLNYQFIQTLDLPDSRVEELCSTFVDWLQRVSLDDPDYMKCFLLGGGSESIPYADEWVKAIVANPEVSKDPFIRKKIRELIINKIQSACCGELFVPGNFQFMVSDPYAFMQHVCGEEPTGLLTSGKFYCNYWNQRGISLVDTMRSPMTYRSEHVLAELVCNEDTERWYRYLTKGFILNWYDNATVRYSGADFDGDILASTSSKAMIEGVYTNELPVTYDAPIPQKKVPTEEDLYLSDVFTFGSIIGSITNKGTNAYALLPIVEEKYGKDSQEARLLLSRLQQCCVAQSKTIDM